MSDYNQLHRAAHDPYYRIAFEDRQRREKESRDIAQTLARGNASRSPDISMPGLSIPSSPEVSVGSYSSSGASSSAEPDAVDRALGAVFGFLAPAIAYVAISYGMVWLWAHHFYKGPVALLFLALFLLLSVGFVVRYWRQAIVIAAIATFYCLR
ncbi:hypothetical protein [Mesorhizobium australicum]|uniref:Uncharacterized protein n=1 Tax=Mesorhizobium australicum TaxID=536018 RepID=A0A1X7N0L7_9HYPH|nr:hypothetical protein [Mesorhizobium australicum]SMH30156.1 hypothetical protein SAMN02982922_1004 [Mesorhizobium australicum]